jgi:tetratricopeptide (TPR) repeat protein
MSADSNVDPDDRARQLREELGNLVGGALTDLGHSLEKKDKPEEALIVFRQAAEMQPEVPLAWYNLGDTLLALGRYQEAIAALEKARALAPEAALVHYDLGLAFYRLEKWEEAAECFGRIAKGDPQLRRAWSVLGLSALTNLALSVGEMGFWTQAREALRPALKKATEVLYNMGRFCLRDGEFREAGRLFVLAAELAPNSEDILHGAGTALLKLKEWEKAETYLARAVKAYPTCRDAWYDRGVALAKQGRGNLRSAARKCFGKVLKLDPKHAWAEYDLACLDALAGKPESAFRRLERAIALGLDDARHILRDPDLKVLRRDVRWKTIAERVNGQTK